MNRYEFELLAYLEKHGEGNYPMRTLSDNLKISGKKISNCIEKMASCGWVKKEKDFLSITSQGLEVLEPYRVKKAVILAAGFGSRMMPATSDRPKPLVTVNGIRIIDTLLDALVSKGITDITIVRGYKKEKFDEILEKYPYVKFIDNDLFDKENNISSVMVALNEIDNCYLCEADLYITNPNVITKYQFVSNILGSYSLETDDWSFKSNNGFICDYQKGNTYCYNYYGISYWTSEDSKKLRDDWAEVYKTNKDVFWEEVPLILKKENYRVEIRQCEKKDIMEIDNYYELIQLDSSYE
ncbi:MAG: phosphocholine cytidylyltransferase family protein [Oscillospiraceae bacterium]|nr:phosphocholine cytidylyltransferase family protein [Oscillospiraceae bacterium]